MGKATVRNKLGVFFFLLLLMFIFWGPTKAHLRALLLITQEFTQIPLKPLQLVTPKPKTQQVEFGEKQKIIADLVLPSEVRPKPALILVMGVYTQEKDRPTLLGFAGTLGRLGYVVLWPRSQVIEEKVIKFEDPQVFVESFNYLKTRPEVDKKRISFVGFSVGSSLAMVAAEDEKIASELHSFVFFGGYYNLYDYLRALATRQITVDGEKVAWEPAEGAISYTQEALELEGVSLESFAKEEIGEEAKENLKRLSPDKSIKNFKTRLFILHDKGDAYVPWIESEKLKKAVGNRIPVTFHLSRLLEHAQASREKFTPPMIPEFLGMYLFLQQVFSYL